MSVILRVYCNDFGGMTLLDLKSGCASPWEALRLQDISLAVDAGEILAIAGPNGAGKTSLLNLLGGSIALSSGRLSFLGRPLAELPLTEKARAIAMLPQRSTLSFPFYVREVVKLGRVPHASGSRADEHIVDATLSALGVEMLADRRYTELSGGEQQRVQLARVLAQVWRAQDSPGRVLLLDEPTAALDYVHLGLLRSLLRQLASQGCAIVLVVHDLNFAADLANKVLLLKAGAVSALGSASAVFNADALENVFGVRPIISTHPSSGKPLVIQQ
ncbi:MAG: heme ABC transporter ATP-binding protein [Congregibacter sp.]